MTKLLSPTQAAKKWGFHRTILYEKMKKGELSYTTDKSKNGKERRYTDPSEMLRVFGEPDSGRLSEVILPTNSGHALKRLVLPQMPLG